MTIFILLNLVRLELRLASESALFWVHATWSSQNKLPAWKVSLSQWISLWRTKEIGVPQNSQLQLIKDFVHTVLNTLLQKCNLYIPLIEIIYSSCDSIGKSITWLVNSTLNCTWKPISHSSLRDSCDIGFRVQFNVEFPRQVMDFPWIA